MSPLLSILPGDIEGLLRRGSPIRCRAVAGIVLSDPWRDGDVLRITIGGDEVSRPHTVSASEVELDLTDPTARAHAAWWTLVERIPPNGWAGFAAPIGVHEGEARRLALMGADMTPEQIDTLARLVLRLAGR